MKKVKNGIKRNNMNSCALISFISYCSEGDGGNVVAGTRRIVEEKPFRAVPGIGLPLNSKRTDRWVTVHFYANGSTTGTKWEKCIRIIVLMIDTLVRRAPLEGPTDTKSLCAPHHRLQCSKKKKKKKRISVAPITLSPLKNFKSQKLKMKEKRLINYQVLAGIGAIPDNTY